MITKFKTAQPIKSLAQHGVNLGKGQPVTPSAFTPERWARLVEDGVVVEVSSPQTNNDTRGKPQTIATTTPLNIDSMTLPELKAYADSLGIEYTKSVRKAALIKKVKDV